MAKVGKQAGKKRAPKAYKMPDPLPQGEVLEDVFREKWKLGTSIGKGGFGEIYSAQRYTDKSSAKSGYPYVIKIEPHDNGPLFVEMHFYMRAAKKVDIDAFMSSKKLESLGMPIYIGSGSHEYKSKKYRFVVMEKYGSDIWKLFLENNRSLPATTVFKMGLQILDVLEYIHSKGYIHGDIKGANMLLSLNNPNQVYLVDFGLAEHYNTSDVYKPDPKRAHNGTIEYLSRDAHLGVQTRRGDLEILIYNLIQWLGCFLPWESNLKDVNFVQKSKEKHMSDIPEFLKACFGSRTPPDAIKDYLKHLLTIKFDAKPDYQKLHNILLAGLKTAGGSLKIPLEFKASKTPSKRRSDTKVTSSSGKKQKLGKKASSKNSNDKLIESDQDDDLSVKGGRQKIQKKTQVSSEEESNPEVGNERQKRMRTRNIMKKKLDEPKEDGSSEGEDVLDAPIKSSKQKVHRNSKQSKEIQASDEEESSHEVDDEQDHPPPQKRKQLVRNKIKKKYEGESEDDNEDTLVVKKQQVAKQYRNKKQSNDNIGDQNKKNKVNSGKAAQENYSDDSDMSTYTAEMKRIKNKMKTVKVSKARRQKVKKNDANSSPSLDKNEDFVSNSEDELPLSVTKKKKAKK